MSNPKPVEGALQALVARMQLAENWHRRVAPLVVKGWRIELEAALSAASAHCNRCAANLCEHDNCTDWTCARACSKCAPAPARDGVRETLEAVEAYKKSLDVPELEDFARGAVIEAQHQRQRWGNEHDTSKEPEEWFWLVGYLAGKGLRAQRDGDMEKFKHHLITGAAVLANWHARVVAAAKEQADGQHD